MMPTPKNFPLAGLVAVVLTISACSETENKAAKNGDATTDSLAAESAATNTTGYQPARTSFGQPDFQGIWDFRTLTPLERPRDLGDKATFTKEEQEAFREKAIQTVDVDALREEAEAAQDVEGAYNAFWMDYGTEMNEDRRTSLIVDPPNGRLPELTQEAIDGMKNATIRNHPVRELFSIGLVDFRPVGPEVLGLSERCLQGFNAGPPLTPSAYNNNLRIVQTPDHVVLVTEMIHTARVIPLDGSDHLPEEIQRWSGDSRGRWEDNTLVVETKNFTGKTPTFQLPIDLQNQDRNGSVGSAANMHLVEKFTRVSEDTLLYEYTLNDPKTFADPFTVAIPLKATDAQIYEYACHEGNYGMRNMLTGARQAEKEEAAAAVN